MIKQRFLIGVLGVLAAFTGFAASGRAETIYGLRTVSSSSGTNRGDRLVRFDSATPGVVTNIGSFTGFVAGHNDIRSIDFRPSNNQLYAISIPTSPALPTTGQLYTVNLTNAVLTPVGTGFSLGTNQNRRVEMDFNPVVDAIRVVTGANTDPTAVPVNQNNNFRVNPNTGALIATDTNLAYADGNSAFTDFVIVGIAYSNNFAGATSTTLYAWDYGGFDTLATIGGGPMSVSPNTGSMFQVSTTTAPQVFVTGAGLGMDISGTSGILYVTHDEDPLDPQGPDIMGLFRRSLAPGAASETLVGYYPVGTFIADISVQSVTTAAEVEVSGRVLTASGRGLLNAKVSITDSRGGSQSTLTGKGGSYSFSGVESGQTYIVSVKSARRFNYAPRFLQINDSLTDVDFTPELSDFDHR
ncbi:MAG: DUF4394 domain-containing protein [Pyrinomonadaceae bacterium]